MRKMLLLAGLIVLYNSSLAAKKRVLFIGNSYTYVNDLPLMLSNVAASTNDTVEYDSHTIGGYTLQQHASDASTISKIMQGNWDFVVLQEQSQRPAFPITQVEADVYPYAKKLDSLIRYYNSCAETIFYMTWGYKNGDAGNCAAYPPICTYQGMDSLLHARYMIMADSNEAIVSPVGPVRRYIRSHYPSIELYDTDGSHPSLAGTYAAACSFYTVIFRKDPSTITYNSSLTSSDANNIRTAAKAVAYDSLSVWFIDAYDPDAQFSYTLNGNSVSFSNQSSNAIQYYWSFGDGDTSTLVNPVHTYANAGSYNVRLIAKKCAVSDTGNVTLNIAVSEVSDVLSDEVLLFPNPVKDMLTIQVPLYLLQGISLTDIHGVKLKFDVIRYEPNKLFIHFSEYSSGVYFIKMIIDGRTEIRKVVKSAM